MLAEQTGCVEFHSSLRSSIKSTMDFIHPAFADSGESYTNNAVDKNEVMAFRNALL
jgi:copper homeostasis protein